MRCMCPSECDGCVQALETEAVREARKKRVAEALSNYKKQAGLEVDPAAEEKAREAYNRGVELMQRVSLLFMLCIVSLHFMMRDMPVPFCAVIKIFLDVQKLSVVGVFQVGVVCVGRGSWQQRLYHLMRPWRSCPPGPEWAAKQHCRRPSAWIPWCALPRTLPHASWSSS